MKQKQEEKNYFLYKLLNFPFFYLLVQFLLYKKNSKSKLFKELSQFDKTGTDRKISTRAFDRYTFCGIWVDINTQNMEIKSSIIFRRVFQTPGKNISYTTISMVQKHCFPDDLKCC